MKLLPRKEFEITIKGETYRGKFGTYAMMLFCKRKGVKLGDLQNIFPEGSELMDFIEDAVELILCALEYGAMIEKKKFGLNKADIFLAIDDKEWEEGELMSILNHSGDEAKNVEPESLPAGSNSNDGSTQLEVAPTSSGD